MQDRWFRHLPKEQQAERKSFIQANKKVLDFLDEILYNMSIDEDKSSPTDYDCPSWAYKQAHVNGFKDALDKVRKLIHIKEI
jgi:hypothetical protein